MEEAKHDKMGLLKNIAFNAQKAIPTAKQTMEDIDEIKNQLALLINSMKSFTKKETKVDICKTRKKNVQCCEFKEVTKAPYVCNGDFGKELKKMKKKCLNCRDKNGDDKMKEMKPKTNRSMREAKRKEIGEDSKGKEGELVVDNGEAIREAYIRAVVEKILEA
ncbi:hypothetical protein J1N35_010128 [Gossypium stocksii]|uniref:Uncharacterized protein n=1 Tax=Gossypium stocksii TaxID=47602 RepID=A0A9D3W1R9_9ROSI|nr:hypothetical protein J1N35_010128 [Gossypium stocksii]